MFCQLFVCYNIFMNQKFVIIRGNSGSGKSTTAAIIRKLMPGKVMFLEQDVLRRNFFDPDVKSGRSVIKLVNLLVTHGKQQGYNVIIEEYYQKRSMAIASDGK